MRIEVTIVQSRDDAEVLTALCDFLPEVCEEFKSRKDFIPGEQAWIVTDAARVVEDIHARLLNSERYCESEGAYFDYERLIDLFNMMAPDGYYFGPRETTTNDLGYWKSRPFDELPTWQAEIEALPEVQVRRLLRALFECMYPNGDTESVALTSVKTLAELDATFHRFGLAGGVKR
jgi:hypothetical protein